MKAKQEYTLTDSMHVSTYFLCTKFDTLNHDGFLVSGGCRSVKSQIFGCCFVVVFLQSLKTYKQGRGGGG